jgi:hypothetical protein
MSGLRLPQPNRSLQGTGLELLPQGWTVRRIQNEPGTCSMTYFFSMLLPGDADFQKQYTRAMDFRNDAYPYATT